ncbi:unnamed protein product [Rotaria sp. Silwood1]|nr:unnamed protein product [Rotaria sp. Silwood1]CAF1462120.1 unnamed protein product [Rotaria sp. Silwood1]
MGKSDKKKVPVGESVVPDGGWGWVIVFSSFLIHFIMDGITYSMGQVFLEPMRTKLSLDRASVSIVFSILPAITLGAGPIATVLTNMYGCRAVAIAGTCIASFGFFLSRLWANIWFYYMTIGVIGGLGFALMYLPAIVSVGLYFEQKRTFAMGIALPLPQEPSEQRRLERKLRKEAEQKQNEQPLSSQNGSATSQNNIAEVVTIEKSPRKSFFNQIIEQIDLNLLKNPAFTLFAVSNFLKNLGFNVIYNYSDDLANDLNVTKNQRIYIVMSVGLSSIFGRLIFGYIGDRKSMNRLFLFIITSIISGVATMVAPLSGSSIFLHIGYASLFGFFSGGSVTLTAIVLVDIVGISKLSDAFGVLLLFIGSAAAIGTPIVGGLRDAFAHFPQPFLWPYLIVGSCTVVSGILLFAIPFLQRKKSSDDHMEIGCDAFYSAEDIPSQEQLQKF